MGPETLFKENRYSLPSCTLHRLREKEAGPVAERLSAIDPWLTLGYRPESLRDYLIRPDPAKHCFVIEVEGRVAGAISIRHPWLDGPYLELFAVFPDHQGAGLGAEMLAWWQEQSFQVAKNLWVLVSSFNKPARGFYLRQGFVEIGTLKDLVRDGCDEILLRKTRD